MLKLDRNEFETKFHYNQCQQPQKPKQLNIQKKDTQLIISEQTKDIFREILNKHPEYYTRIYWILVGTLQLYYDERNENVELDFIEQNVKTYLKKYQFIEARLDATQQKLIQDLIKYKNLNYKMAQQLDDNFIRAFMRDFAPAYNGQADRIRSIVKHLNETGGWNV